METEKRIHSLNCFGCSSQNPIGLKIAFEANGDGIVAEAEGTLLKVKM